MNRCLASGLTIAELALAMAITALVGLSVTGVFMAMSTAQAHSDQHYLYAQTARCAARHVQVALRKAKLVTAADDTGLVLWARDSNGDGSINVSELLVFAYGSASGELEQVRIVFPESMPAETRAALDVGKSLASVTSVAGVQVMMQNDFPSYYVRELLADGVLELSRDLAPAPPLTRTVKLRIKVGKAKRNVVAYACATLRDDNTDRVGTASGEYVLLAGE